jgi:hypothetical protein
LVRGEWQIPRFWAKDALSACWQFS